MYRRLPLFTRARSIGDFLLVAVCGLMLLAALTDAQTPNPKKSSRTKSAKTTTSHTAPDSTGTADSVRNARVVPGSRADTVSRRPDAVVTAPADTVKRFVYRKMGNKAWGVGERMVFDIKYGFVTAGEAVLTIPAADSVGGRRAYRIEVKVNSLPAFSWVYRVEDRYLTFIDVEALVPLRFEQHIREGSYARDFVAEFDQERNIARTTEGNYPIPPYVHDIMSAFFYVRALDLGGMNPGDIITLQNFYKDKTFDLGVRLLGRQELEVDAGTFNTIVVEPLVKEGGLFKSEGRIVVWLSDDEIKLPIRINTKIVIGSIDAELREYSGLLGPVTARVK